MPLVSAHRRGSAPAKVPTPRAEGRGRRMDPPSIRGPWAGRLSAPRLWSPSASPPLPLAGVTRARPRKACRATRALARRRRPHTTARNPPSAHPCRPADGHVGPVQGGLARRRVRGRLLARLHPRRRQELNPLRPRRRRLPVPPGKHPGHRGQGARMPPEPLRRRPLQRLLPPPGRPVLPALSDSSILGSFPPLSSPPSTSLAEFLRS